MATGHDVRVDVDGIDGIADRDLHVRAEKLLNVAAVAFRAVGDEDLVRRNVDAAVLEVDLGDLLAQKGVALFRTVSVEIALASLIVHRLVHGGDDGRRQRLGDVADAETDHLRVRMRLLMCGHAMGDLRKEVSGLDFRVVFVNVQHGSGPDFLLVFVV